LLWFKCQEDWPQNDTLARDWLTRKTAHQANPTWVDE
jgi:hypothetical protein